jgi:hypothetical protein
MKYLFLVAGILIFEFASAQKDEVYYFQKQLKKTQQKKTITLPEYQSPVLSLPQKDVAYVFPDGNTMTTLPQDNMPCIMPDMSQFNMPCVIPEKQNYNMPLLSKQSNQPGDKLTNHGDKNG